MTEGKAEQLLIELVTKLDTTPLERCHNAKGFKNWYDNWKRIHGIDTSLVQEVVPMPAEAATEVLEAHIETLNGLPAKGECIGELQYVEGSQPIPESRELPETLIVAVEQKRTLS